MTSHNIFHDLSIHASSERVFNAISDPKHLMNWWPLKCSGSLELNGEYNFFFTKEYDWQSRIIDLKINNYIEFEMIRSDPDWAPTNFRFELIAKDNGTLLQFSHCNWPENNHHFRRSSYCWAILLKGLKDYIEKEKIIPFDERA